MTSSPAHGVSIGIDFGTTNSVIAIATPGGKVEPVTFLHDGRDNRIFPSTLCFWEERRDGALALQVESGPWAIATFLESAHPHRFLQSFKTYAASKAFQETRIFRKRFDFETLLETFMASLKSHVGATFATQVKDIAIGRPVRFAGEHADEALAMTRYRTAFARLGFPHAHFVYEPVGAAFHFAQTLSGDDVVLVADFGGGTSDFSVMRFHRQDGQTKAVALGHAGIGIAGDAFDYRIIDRVVSPRLGKGTDYVPWDKRLTMPNRYYANFARWSQLALMKSSGELKDLRALQKQAIDPDAIGDFIEIIENDLGFELYRAVTAAKIELSSQDKTALRFAHGQINISAEISRQAFESWIAEDVAAIARTVDAALANARIAGDAISKVFLTGGSSFIPAIRRIFTDRFGDDKITSGDQFESIAYGLALIGQSPSPGDWASK
jgi:hypothetical chaperone protein